VPFCAKMIITLESCKDLNDNEIVAKSLENLDYFSCLYQRYEPELIRYIRRISGLDAEEAQDILQESFIKIWRNLNDFDPGLKLSTWIYRVVHNETVSFIRKKKSYGKDKTIDYEILRNILSEDIDNQQENEQKIVSTLEFLEQLPFKYKEVLVLKFLENRSYEEISDILKIPEGTVAIRISRGKKIFHKLLNNK
jgi:RNA polymerase sigma-70 factor, ECF subfamily